MEAIIPLEAGLPTMRTQEFNSENNDKALAAVLDEAEEQREAARIRIAAYQQTISQGYNARVRPRTFKPDDLVLRKVVGTKRTNKLGPNWEGPYRVIKIVGVGSYKLEDLDGTPIPRPWNAHNLRRYYH
jgi:hypothetical protein